MSSEPAFEHSLSYTVWHFLAALGIGVFAGGVGFFIIGALFSYAAGGAAAVDSSIEGILGSLLFAIVLVGLFGGMPGAIIGIVMLHFGARSLIAYIAGGIAASTIAPLLVMLFTPLGVDGWRMLLIAVPSGAIAATAAWFYLTHHTTLLSLPRG